MGFKTISMFKGMAYPIVCPRFLELKAVYGCPYDCLYCYLRGTLAFLSKRGHVPMMPFEAYLRRLTEMSRDLGRFFKVTAKPCLLNAGELGEPLMFEKSSIPLSLWLMRAFGSKANRVEHKVLILTKSADTKKIERVLETISVNDSQYGCPEKYLVMAFSLTTEYTNRNFEGAPPSSQRLGAAGRLQRLGIPVRLRFDPLFPLPNEPDSYSQIHKLVAQTDDTVNLSKIERITLGTPRINNPKLWQQDFWRRIMHPYMLQVALDTGKRVWRMKRTIRKPLYEAAISKLRDHGYRGPIALCKETVEMWKELGLDPQNCKCNCVM